MCRSWRRSKGLSHSLLSRCQIRFSMRSFGFRVVSADPDDMSGIPISIAGGCMVDIQRLLTDIGCMLLRTSMRLQNSIPANLKAKFDLTIGGDSGSGLDSLPTEGNGDALEGALDILCSTLDFLGKGAVGSWMTDTFQDDESRETIAKDLIALAEHIDGYVLEYGPADDVRTFRGLEKEKIRIYTDNKEWISAIVGIVSRDPVKKNHWVISNDEYAVPVSFDRNIVSSDIPKFASAGPVILVGKGYRNAEGHFARMDKVHGCYTIPELKFHRIITADGDIDLLNPLTAVTGYDAGTDTWTLRNDIVGISISKPSWDECIISFHEYAMFLFKNYVYTEDAFEGEEKETREYLMSLLPAI